MSELAEFKGQVISIGSCEDLTVMPSVLKECTQVPFNENPKDPQFLQTVRFPIPEGVIACKITSGPVFELLNKEGHFCSCGAKQAYQAAGFGIRRGFRAAILRCCDCGKVWNISAENRDLFTEAMDAFGGDITNLVAEWKVLEAMLN